MLVFKACGECDNVVECPHTPKYNEEISYLMFAQKNFTTADVKVECQYFKARNQSGEYIIRLYQRSSVFGGFDS